MGGNISANTIFHFTNSSDNLINILINGFYPCCCMENLEFIYKHKNYEFNTSGFAIPMVCFCDIPLSQIHNHSDKFGKYALGLSKEWGKQIGINPVMYVMPDSNAIETIRKSLLTIIPYLMDKNTLNDNDQETMRKLGNELIFFSCYLKPYKGQKWDGKGFNGDEILFYDEMEWRYIPSYNKILENNLKPYLFSHEFLNERKRNRINEEFKKHFKLRFKAEDIKYIIVEKEKEVLELLKKVKNVRDSAFQNVDIDFLTTRIISVERLKDDF